MKPKASQAGISIESLVCSGYYGNILFSRIVAFHVKNMMQSEIKNNQSNTKTPINWDTRNLNLQMTSV